MRLIDADVLAERPIPKSERNYRTYNLDDAYEDGYYDAMAEVRNAPSINIVRCKECKHWKKVTDKDGDSWEVCNKHMIFTNVDDFCSYGKREEK